MKDRQTHIEKHRISHSIEEQGFHVDEQQKVLDESDTVCTIRRCYGGREGHWLVYVEQISRR